MWIILTILLALTCMWLIKVNKDLVDRNNELIARNIMKSLTERAEKIPLKPLTSKQKELLKKNPDDNKEEKQMIYKIVGTNKKGQDLDTKVKLTQEELNSITNELYKNAVEPIPADELTSLYLFGYSEDDEWDEMQKEHKKTMNMTPCKDNIIEPDKEGWL